MFDIGFWELAVIGVIALLVIGPERLPGVARNVGLWVGRIRRYVAHVKRDIERELHADEVRELLEKPEGLDDLRSIAREATSVLQDTRKELDAAAREAAADTVSAPDVPRAGGKPAAAAVPVPGIGQQAGDADPFAAESIARVSPADGPGHDATPQPAGPQRPSTGSEDDEQSGRQGQR